MPARNEALSLPSVLRSVPREMDRVIVADNGSTDNTAQIARAAGAQVVAEPRPGYGRACLAALAAMEISPPDIVAFADADGSDDLSRLPELIDPLTTGEADFTLERRIPVEANALSLQQRLGNWLATRLVRFLWGYAYQDLGPMRAITWSALRRLDMNDPNYGWTIEMQVRALQHGLRVMELPVPYRSRKAGRSKVSGTITGSLRAGAKILSIIGHEALRERRLLSKKTIARPTSHGSSGSH
jgi:glycosyltransferase involved in cell wall biosynthesis